MNVMSQADVDLFALFTGTFTAALPVPCPVSTSRTTAFFVFRPTAASRCAVTGGLVLTSTFAVAGSCGVWRAVWECAQECSAGVTCVRGCGG